MTGCSKKEELICDIADTKITVTVKNGKIISYYDEVKGNSSDEDIKILNDSYLEDVNDNSEALSILKDVIAQNGGNCNAK